MPPSKPCRILVVEDQEIVRIGLTMIIEQWENFILVGDAADGRQAVELVPELKPDIVLMDIIMPDMDGIEATSLLRRRNPEVKVVMLTSDKHSDTVFAALASGAQGYCLKDVSPARLQTGIECVRSGDLWIDAKVAEKIFRHFATEFKAGDSIRTSETAIELDDESIDLEPGAEEPLSKRELEVLNLIVDGLSNVEIANQLYISRDTVKTHVHKILRKLAASDRTHAAVKAVRQGIVKQ